MRRFLLYIFLLFGCFTISVSCKKYPENKLWFKNPKNIDFMKGHLTHYIVNGIDSISYLDNFFYNDLHNNPYSHQFSDLTVWSQKKSKGSYEVTFYSPDDYASPYSIIQNIEYNYVDNGKKIELSGTDKIIETYKKNIFLSDEVSWEIIYLSKKDDKRKMKGTYQGNVYELQFN